MNFIRNLYKKKFFFILLLLVVSVSAFFIGRLTSRYDISYPFSSFYSAPKGDDSDLFDKKNVEYPFTFIVYGDSRELAVPEKPKLIKQIINENPSFVLHLGDMVAFGDPHQWEIFDLFDGQIIDSQIPFYPVLGNHEYNTMESKIYGSTSSVPEVQLQYYFERFKFLENRRWYSFVYGNSSFLILDTNTDYSEGSEQYEWLINKLKEEQKTFVFVAFHRPPYTKAYTKRMKKYFRPSEKLLANIFENYKNTGLGKVDIVFSAHAHNYERYKNNNINYIVSGGGGAEPYLVDRDKEDFYTETGDILQYCKIKILKEKIVFQMIRLNRANGEWIPDDIFIIQK